MKESMIQVICGPGRGKSTGALGRGISALNKGCLLYTSYIWLTLSEET